MMPEKQSLRQRIIEGEKVVGTFYKMDSPIATEILGIAGFDFIVVDREHADIDYRSMEDIIRTATSVGLDTVVRVPSWQEEHIFHALDAGASGVQIPNLTNVDEISEAVKRTKYYPEGCRGLSRTTRAARYGSWNRSQPFEQYSNENSLVIVHIENKEMAEKVEEICRIPQIDVVFVGPADMSQSLGIPGKSKDPRVMEVAEKVIKTAVKFGKIAGINVLGQDDLEFYLKAGASYFTYGSDTGMLMKSAKSIVSTFKQSKETIKS